MPETPYDYDKADRSGIAGGYYHAGVTDREPYLARARRVSELTIPTLFRSEGANGADDQIIPWNSIGAYCVNNLASKVVTTLFPPGRAPMVLEQGEKAATDLLTLPEAEQGAIKEIINKGLSAIEQKTSKAIEADGDRARMYVAALRMLIGGNHGLQFYDDGTLRGIPLERFVVTRDGQGSVIRFGLLDNRDWADLETDIREGLEKSGVPYPMEADASGKRPVRIYTYGTLIDGRYRVHQECLGMEIEGTRVEYNKKRLPFLFLPWLLLDEEHYGRSYCEFYEGDLLTAESLTKSLGEGAAAIARFLTLVNPTGLTNKKTFAAAKNGDVITGREQDVSVFKAEKGGDFSVAKAEVDDTIGRLSRAFLLNSSVQRSGERVTAEEIRYMAAELEDALGGVYSQQTVTWQQPYVETKLRLLQKAGRVQKLPEGAVTVTVTGGLGTLARNAEITQLRTGASILTETFGADKLTTFVKPSVFAARVWAALGVDSVGLVPTEEEQAAEAQQAMMQQMAAQVAPEALKQVGNNITSNQVAQTNADAKVASSAPAPTQGA